MADDGKPLSYVTNGVRYYEIKKGGDTLYIVAAAGHLFTIKQRSDSDVPVFDVEWVESYKVNKSAYFTKKYIDTIYAVGKKCSFYINACDYDIEGTVIGSNLIKYVVNSNVNSELPKANVKRMKFSTTTKPDLVKSYENVSDFDFENFYAGEARHKLDWMWGINLSRSLMRAISTQGVKKILSIGRVQGPALGLLAERELAIKNFSPKDYWKIFAFVNGTEFECIKGSIFDAKEAESIIKNAGKEAKVESVEKNIKEHWPFPPFDLTSLQLEASRVFKMDPSRTLAVAQSLYERSYISYPRTSSQKLPFTLNFRNILNMLSKIEGYKEDALLLINGNRFKPIEGKKADEAHPAIYPTGEEPKKLTAEEQKLYDLITRRFLACFAESASTENNEVVIGISDEKYRASGSRLLKKGWIEIYKYYNPKTRELPEFGKGDLYPVEKIESRALKTEPPRRYNKASLISTLEEKELGTKATRAEIIDTLFRREYIRNSQIEVTGFGMSIYDALHSYCPDILDEQLTRKLEEDMDSISKGTLESETVIKEGKDIITKITNIFKEKQTEIGKRLSMGLEKSEMEASIGKCKCGGDLIVRRSTAGKSFVQCNNCQLSYPLPQYSFVKPTGKTCEFCGTPIVKVFRRGKRVFQMCLDPNCETKKDWGKPKTAAQIKSEQEGTEKKADTPAVKKTTKKAPVRKTQKKADSKKRKVKKAAKASE